MSLASKKHNVMKSLLHRRVSSRLASRAYSALRDSSSAFSPGQLEYYSASEDVEALLAAIQNMEYVPTAIDIFRNFKNESLFEILYEHASASVQKTALMTIIKSICSLNAELLTFSAAGANLGSKAGKLGLSLPQYAPFFLDVVQMKPEVVTVEFLNFLHISGIDFNSSVFSRENFFEHSILDGRLDLADFMADHGAKFSKICARYMRSLATYLKLQHFVMRRAWIVLKDLFPGLADPNSSLQILPKEIIQYHIIDIVMESVKAGLFPK